ncbi:MAG TPA: hypothetical protein VE957_08160 [Terriglobales bacterium]|nr:hypothetical protein [Terriglobales bacterium]
MRKCTRIPWNFFQTVIDEHYDAGLRFFVLVFDHVDASYGGAAGHLFYSVSSDFACDNDPLDCRSTHCIGLTVADYVTSADPEEMPHGDGGDDLDLPCIDPEDNAVPERSVGGTLNSEV